MERRLAAAPEMTCTLPQGQVASLRAVTDMARAAGQLPAPEATDPPVDDDTPAPW